MYALNNYQTTPLECLLFTILLRVVWWTFLSFTRFSLVYVFFLPSDHQHTHPRTNGLGRMCAFFLNLRRVEFVNFLLNETWFSFKNFPWNFPEIFLFFSEFSNDFWRIFIVKKCRKIAPHNITTESLECDWGLYYPPRDGKATPNVNHVYFNVNVVIWWIYLAVWISFIDTMEFSKRKHQTVWGVGVSLRWKAEQLNICLLLTGGSELFGIQNVVRVRLSAMVWRSLIVILDIGEWFGDFLLEVGFLLLLTLFGGAFLENNSHTNGLSVR